MEISLYSVLKKKKKKKKAEKLDNQFIPKYIPSDLKWYEHSHEHSPMFRNANRNDVCSKRNN